MPRAKQRCSPTCKNIKGECKEHMPARVPWESKRERAFLKTAEWQRQRRRVLHRDKYTCQLCGRENSHQVDHVLPVWYTEKEQVEDEELQTLCDSCHSKKSSFEGVQAKKIKKLKGQHGNV